MFFGVPGWAGPGGEHPFAPGVTPTGAPRGGQDWIRAPRSATMHRVPVPSTARDGGTDEGTGRTWAWI